MRYFNDTEKEVIDYICTADPNSDASTVKKLFEVKCDYSMQKKNDYLTIFVANPSSAQTIVTRILNIICILEYLKTQGLIYLFGNIRVSKILINKEHGHVAMEEECDFIIPDDGETLPAINIEIEGKKSQVALNPIHLSKDISNKIFESFNCTFFCTETLRQIRKQEYKDDETVRYEENKEQTNKAIKISLGIGIGSILVGIIVGCVTFCQNERHHQESMSQTQKIVIVHDTITSSDQQNYKNMNNMFSKSANDSLVSTKTNTR